MLTENPEKLILKAANNWSIEITPNASKKIEDFSTKLKKYKEQLFLVKSNKEYDAITQEIDHMKTTISESETVQFQCEEEKIDLEETIKLNSNKIESTSESLSSNRIALQSAMAETTHEQEKLESNRNILYKDIEPTYLNHYETLRNAREGVGMASIIGSACGGCYSQLPPQMVIEIKENKQIITCPSCDILQFWDGTEE